MATLAMAHRPRSPMQTHLAPSLPEPVCVPSVPPLISAQHGLVPSTTAPSFSCEAGKIDIWSHCVSTCQPSNHLRQTADSPWRGRQGAGQCGSLGEKGFRAWNSALPLLGPAEERNNVRESMPPMVATAPAERPTCRGMPAHVAPTAYEAALAEYGKKLIDITQKQQQAQKQRSQEILSRRRAVNEKYTYLSRPPVSGDSAARTSAIRRENATNDKNALRRRNRDGSPIAALRETMSVVDVTPKAPGACQSRREVCGRPVTPVPARKRGGGGGSRRGRESVTGKRSKAKCDSESVMPKMDEPPDKRGGQRGHRRRCCSSSSSSSSSSDRDAATQTRTEHDQWAQTDCTFFGSPPVAISPASCHFPQHQYCCCRSSSERRIGPLGHEVGKSLETVGLSALSRLASPRPLHRAFSSCSLGDHRSSPSLFPLSSGHSGRRGSVLQHHTAAYETHHKLLRCASAELEPHYHPKSRDTRDVLEDLRRPGQQVLTPSFLWPQREPRPLHRHHETQITGNGSVGYLQGTSFSAPALDRSGGICSFLYGSPKLCNEQGMEMKKRRLWVRNALPQYNLDGGLQRRLLHTAWRRWRRRLELQRVMNPLSLDGAGRRWADVEAWLHGSTAHITQQ